MIKVRFKTWYWGNYCLCTEKQAKNLPEGFELYCENSHGWKNSEEWKIYKKTQYKTEFKDTLDQFLNCSYYQSLVKKGNKA
jgi:hypothetical protein